jgi:class 3 adenylate cyclase/tetratricopeptide (TPR) repeat protein
LTRPGWRGKNPPTTDQTANQGAAEASTPETWCQTAETLLKSGAALMAYDAVSSGLRAFPDHLRLRQLLALSLARAGATEEANAILRRLRDAGHVDEETLGLLARTYKDLWAAETSTDLRRDRLRRAHLAYREAYDLTAGYWSGVNVATTALLLGDRDTAAAVARQVHETCVRLRGADPHRADLYWVLATLGEAALLLGDHAAARAWYCQAVALDPHRLGDLVSTRRNARLILRHLGAETAAVDACFPIPRIVAFAGHLADKPGRSRPRFPQALEPAVRDAVGGWLRDAGAVIGYSSAACGADLIFLEALAAAGARFHVVLPYNRELFVRDSVDVVPGADWAARFERALARAADITVASDQPIGTGGASYEYAFRLLDGAAAIRADELDTELVCLAVWDGEPGDGAGGTAAAVEHWRLRGRRVEVIDLARLDVRGDAGARVTGHSSPWDAHASEFQAEDSRFSPRLVGLLFADAPGFSQLSDTDLPRFVEDYLGLAAREMERLDTRPLLANTWGDGLYLVFGSVRDAGVFALRLCAAVRSTDWSTLGFRSAMSIRIGLHAGPAYACIDPVTGRPNYIGAHVSRAARIEPITPPGAVYASGAFASLARADGVAEFTFSYVGPTPLAKGYGTFPTFLVKQASGRL